MKKIYLILLLITFSFIGYGQSPIVTIDRANIPGPTITGTVANMSAIGLTRGAGINQRNGTNHSSRDWNAISQTEAESNNDYIEWSVIADAEFDVNVSEIDIRLRRSNNGPANWQLFYSTDGFTSDVVAVNGEETLAEGTGAIYNLTGLNINSGVAGTLTFRLYAWNAATNGGWLRIRPRGAWSDFGVDLPGIRFIGNINSTSPNSKASIIEATSFNPTQNINYLAYPATATLSPINSLKVGEFIISDDVMAPVDPDFLPTILTELTFDIRQFDNLDALAILDSGINIAQVDAVGSSTTFNNIAGGTGIIAPDNGTKVFSIYATFKDAVTDNDKLRFIITNAVADVFAGSDFADPDAGGAQTRFNGNYNRIEVTATELNFDVQPTNVTVFTLMNPAPVVIAADVNGNTDLDYNGEISVSASVADIAPSSTIDIIAVNGVATFDNLIFTSANLNEQLVTISNPGLSFELSNEFDVLGYMINIAKQDFDGGTPDWSYVSDIPFFQNGWGTDGYYDIIAVSNASPLDYASFSDNILGVNDLNDEGNGTTQFATITFSDVNISAYSNVSLTFDYDISGYGNNDDLEYQVFYDGVGQGFIELSTASDIEGTVNIAIPDNTDLLSLQVRVKSSGDTTFAGLDNFMVTSIFDGLIYFADTWTPSAPNNTTGNLNALVLNGTYSVTGPTAIDNIIVIDSANMLIDMGESLLVNGELICNDNVLLNSDSQMFASLIVDGSVSGDVTYSRHVNTNASVLVNDLISAPVSGETFGELASNNSNIFSSTIVPTRKLFGPFDKITGLYLNYNTAIPAEANVILEPGIGYRAASSDGMNFDFSGVVNTAAVNVPIVIAGPNNPEWNLVGNPYPSYLSLSEFLSPNNSQFAPTRSGIYGYDGNASDGWIIWNQAYSLANPDARIAPGQGFLVASGLANGNISFTPIMRAFGNTDDFIPGRMSNPEISHLELTLTGSEKLYKTDFYFTENATLGLDPGYDSEVFGSRAPSFAVYSHLIEDSIGNDIGIQSVGMLNLSDITIPIGVNASQGQQITFSITETTLSESTEVYLEDNVANTYTLLTDMDYTLNTLVALNGTGRFFLRFSENSLSQNESVLNNLQIFATANPKALFVKGNLTDSTTVSIFDLQGRLVMSSILDISSNTNRIDVSNLSSGIYAVAVTSKSLTKTKKIIIK